MTSVMEKPSQLPYHSEEDEDDEEASEDGEVQEESSPVKAKTTHEGTRDAPAPTPTPAPKAAVGSMQARAKKLFEQQVDFVRSRHQCDKLSAYDTSVTGGPSGTWAHGMVIKGCSLMDSNPGFGKNPQQAAAMPSNKIIKVMMLGVKPKAGFGLANWNPNCGTKSGYVNKPENLLYKNTETGMIMGRSYKMLANKKRGPPDEKWGALPPGVIQNVCFWADEAADGPKHKLMEAGHRSIPPFTMVRMNMATMQNSSKSFTEKNMMWSMKDISFEPKATPFYSGVFNRLNLPDSDEASERQRIALTSGDIFQEPQYAPYAPEVDLSLGRGNLSETSVCFVIQPSEADVQILTEGGDLRMKLNVLGYAGISCQSIRLHMAGVDFQLAEDDEMKLSKQKQWVETLLCLMLIPSCVKTVVAYDKYNGPPAENGTVDGYVSVDDEKFYDLVSKMDLLGPGDAAFDHVAERLPNMEDVAVGLVAPRLAVAVVMNEVNVEDVVDAKEPPQCSVLHTDNLVVGHICYLVVCDESDNTWRVGLKFGMSTKRPGTVICTGKRKFEEVDM